jgi:hypothetical protein
LGKLFHPRSLGSIRYFFNLSPTILSDVSRSLAVAVIFPRVLFNASIIISLSNVDIAASNEHGGIAVGNMIDHFKDLSHFIAAAHDVMKAVSFFELFSKG